MNKKNRKNLGATLLELLLAIAVIIVIIAASYQTYSYFHIRMITAELEESLTQIFILGNEYYYAGHCLDSDLTNKNFTDLANWAIDNKAFCQCQLNLIRNPVGDPWQFKYEQTIIPGNTPVTVNVLQASVRFPRLPIEQIRLLQTQLKADSIITNNTLTWTRQPTQIMGDRYNDSMWVSNNDVMNFAKLNQSQEAGANKLLCPA